MDSAWAEWFRSIAGLLIGGAVTYYYTSRERHATRIEIQHGIAALLWNDLNDQADKLRQIDDSRDMNLDVSLWAELRIDLAKSGIPIRTLANAMRAYRAMEFWNGLLDRQARHSFDKAAAVNVMLSGAKALGRVIPDEIKNAFIEARADHERRELQTEEAATEQIQPNRSGQA